MQLHERIASARRSHALNWLMVLGTVDHAVGPRLGAVVGRLWPEHQHTALSTGPSQLPR